MRGPDFGSGLTERREVQIGKRQCFGSLLNADALSLAERFSPIQHGVFRAKYINLF
jgi:hypothetical protein